MNAGTPLPIVLSIPHGALTIPPELQDRVALTPADIFAEADAYTADFYDVGADVAGVVRADAARAIIDVNRAPDELPPVHKDGVIKVLSSYGKPTFSPGKTPAAGLSQQLLQRYYHPYHAALRRQLQTGPAKLGLDCHAMEPIGPPHGRGAGKPRPLFCLSNVNGKSADNSLLEKLAAALMHGFGVARGDVLFNDPFQGGYIVKTYGKQPLPWLQLEMNKKLYLRKPWYDETRHTVHPDAIQTMRRAFRQTLQFLVAYL